MTNIHGFELLEKRRIRELNTEAFHYRHIKTGAELLSLVNDDENKVFGISFRTPSLDSTGVAHILEHSVLCGSRKYPVKEPFVELLKGSLKTFLNAFTYPDKTCYPVASQNLQDFYNLVDVYLDAVFHPRLTPSVLKQEGWHYEMDGPDGPLSYKGVVFNEMKGAYSSPERTLGEYSQQCVFPDNAYGVESGGEPAEIPNLTFERFQEFHRKFYHPSNARIFFCGDDDPQQRLRIADEYLREYDFLDVDSEIALQPRFESPKRIVRPYAAGTGGTSGAQGMVTVNWLLPETTDAQANIALHILHFILLGMPGSPLRKALMESGLGEDLSGVGIEGELRQMYFSTGMKGIDPANADRVEALIIETLGRLAKEGIDPLATEAAINTIEFSLRENNAGSTPRGLVLMLRALTTWLYGGDPMVLLAFETQLESMKSCLLNHKSCFEEMIDRFLLQNPHRVTLILEPDTQLGEREAAREREELERVRASKTPEELRSIFDEALELKRKQETPDSPEALATIPSLRVEDLDRKNKQIPLEIKETRDARVLSHDIASNGVIYFDLGLDLHTLAPEHLPYAPLFGRALLEMGTEKEDYVALTQRISRKTGGIRPRTLASSVRDANRAAAWLFLRGKAMSAGAGDLLDILRDVLLTVRLDDKERFRQMVLEEKAGQEQELVPSGHRIVESRLRSHFREADWVGERIGGVSYLFFLRRLAGAIDNDWPSILDTLEAIRRNLVNRKAMLVNVTADSTDLTRLEPLLRAFLDALPARDPVYVDWVRESMPEFEGLTMPAQVNYVGKGADLYASGYRFHGSSIVIARYLRSSWLWDRVRVQGGAYGAFCNFSRLSGVFTFVSYRDPNLLKTLEVFDQTARFLRDIDLSKAELAKGIIGAIGEIDAYLLPDSKGYNSMLRTIGRDSEEVRQRVRDEVLGTTIGDFKAFADVLENVREKGIVKVLGSESAIADAVSGGLGLSVTKVL